MRRYRIAKNDLVVIVGPDRVKDLAANPDMRVTWFAAENRFLQNQLPSNNYSIGGSISLNQDPVIPLSDEEALHILADFHRLRDRMEDIHLQFYRELMGSLCLTMMYDIFEAHTRRDASGVHTDRTSYINRHTVPILKKYLNDERLSLTQISEMMNFSSLSYFSRYCSKHLGQSPSEYRGSIQPRRQDG